jgi:hypothetical protein
MLPTFHVGLRTVTIEGGFSGNSGIRSEPATSGVWGEADESCTPQRRTSDERNGPDQAVFGESACFWSKIRDQ